VSKRAKVIWLSGLSVAGKTTIALELEKCFSAQGISVMLLDGDVLRNGLNADLGFSEQDRLENIRRSAEVAKLFSEQGFVVICSFITPLQGMRNLVKQIVEEQYLIDVFVDCSLVTCEKRDVKGLYQKARLNQVKNFTGISASFERPLNPKITINTEHYSVSACAEQVINFFKIQ
jgi:adenylylsulfate kinase